MVKVGLGQVKLFSLAPKFLQNKPEPGKKPGLLRLQDCLIALLPGIYHLMGPQKSVNVVLEYIIDFLILI